MTLVNSSEEYPHTDAVMGLYRKVAEAHQAGSLTEDQYHALLETAAIAESQKDIEQVEERLEEMTRP